MKKVVIVNAGGRMSLSAEKGDYQSMVDYLERTISGLENPNRAGEKVATVQVVAIVREARQLIERADIMIFMTAGLLGEARIMKQSNNRAKVVVLTGLLPDNDVVLVDKRWLSHDLVSALVK